MQTDANFTFVEGPRTDRCVSCETRQIHYLTIGPDILVCSDCADKILTYWIRNRWFRNAPKEHKARLYRSYDHGYVIECSCKRWSMVGGTQKGLRSAHAVHSAEHGEAPAWLIRLVGLDGGES